MKRILIGSEVLLLLASVAVVAGLIGELKSEKWNPPPAQIKRWHVVYVWLVILGVAGELIGDGGIFLSSHRLQTIADREIATLNAKIAPRRLDPEQQKAISLALGKFSGRVVELKSYSLDTEAITLAHQIGQSLNPWIRTVDATGMIAGTGWPLTEGVSVTGSDAQLVAALTKALHDEGGLQVTNKPVPEAGGAQLNVRVYSDVDAVAFVGIKPLAK